MKIAIIPILPYNYIEQAWNHLRASTNDAKETKNDRIEFSQ